MSQGVCIASSRAVVAAAAAPPAAAAAAPAALQQPAARHHEECSEGQATNSACHSTESLVVALLPQHKMRTHTCSLCDAVNCHNSIAWLSAALLTTDRYSLPHPKPHRHIFCLLARGLDSVASNKS